MAEKTRRAYGLDVGELAVWADGAGVSPDGVGHRLLRRYAAHLAAARREGGRALSHQTVARKLAAIRSFYGHMVERGELDQNPADLVPSPRRPRGLPRAAARRRGRPAARPDPGPHAARDPRPRHVRARLLVRPALRGGRQPRPRLGRFRRRGAARARQGLEDPDRAGRRAGPGRARALSRQARQALLCSRDRAASPRCSFPRRAAACRPPTCAAACGSGCGTPASRAASRRTPCDTPSPPTCSRAARTCARSRSCWATPASRRPRSTLG